MIIIEEHIVQGIENPTRIYDYCVGVFDDVLPSRASVKKAIKKGVLLLNGEKVESSRWVNNNDLISVIEKENSVPKEYHLSLELIFEDDYIAVINKPPGIVVSGNQFKNIENALKYNLKKSTQKDALSWPKPVHRLDAPTSGLLIIAKTKKSQINLGEQFKNKTISKKYIAIVQGSLKGRGIVTKNIENKKASTNYSAIKTIPSLKNEFLTLIELFPETGRTHQLRIHMVSLGCPIVGDKLYGVEGNTLLHKGLFLSAIGLKFNHPIFKNEMSLEIQMPNKFNLLLEKENRRWLKFKS